MSTITSSSLNIYHSVQWQNDMIQSQMNRLRDKYSTDKQKIYFLTQDLDRWSYISFILLCIYYGMCFVVAYIVFMGSTHEYTSLFYKLVILIISFSFPILVIPLGTYLTNGILYARSYLSGTIYEQSDPKGSPSISNQLLLFG